MQLKMIINENVIPENQKLLDCTMDHKKQSEEIVFDILNETINFVILSTEQCNSVSRTESFETCASPMIQSVPMNSPVNITDSKDRLKQEPMKLSLAISEAFSSKTNNIKEDDLNNTETNFCISNISHGSQRHIPNVNSPEFIPRSTSISLANTKLNPNAPPWCPQSQQMLGTYRSTIENLHCLKLNQKREQPIRNNKLEFELKKLIKEIQDIDYGAKQDESTIDNDKQGEKKEKSNDNNMFENSKETSNISNSVNKESNDNGPLITKKSCLTNLIQRQHEIDSTKQVHSSDEYQEDWEVTQEKEIIVINPEYSSSSDNDSEFLTIIPDPGPMYDVDLTSYNNNMATHSEGGKGDILDQRLNEPAFVVPPNTPEVLISPSLHLPSEKEEIKSPLSVNEKKSKKKKWSLGNRILGLFSRKPSPNN